jgi:hypothetical protein
MSLAERCAGGPLYGAFIVKSDVHSELLLFAAALCADAMGSQTD